MSANETAKQPSKGPEPPASSQSPEQKMSIGEAIYRRSVLKDSINRLCERIPNNMMVQEGEEPAEEPHRLIQSLESELKNSYVSSRDIYYTNDKVKCDTGETISQLSIKRKSSEKKSSHYKSFAYAARRAISNHQDILKQITVRDESTYLRKIGKKETEEIDRNQFDLNGKTLSASWDNCERQRDEVYRQSKLSDELIQSLNWSTPLLKFDVESL